MCVCVGVIFKTMKLHLCLIELIGRVMVKKKGMMVMKTKKETKKETKTKSKKKMKKKMRLLAWVVSCSRGTFRT